MSKRIAVIVDSDIYCQRGIFNAVRNRIKYLRDQSDFDIDAYVIGFYEPWYIRKLHHTNKVDKVDSVVLDGIKYHTLWCNFTLTDYILEKRLHLSPVFIKLFYRRLVNKIRGYDIISAHSTYCGLAAYRISKRDGVPFCVTWHGSDIHTEPFVNKSLYKIVKKLLAKASCNFFVSDKLLKTGLTIVPSMNCDILYNGSNESFKKYPEETKKQLRISFGVPEGSKVVAFVGGLIDIKNPQLLVPIFDAVRKKYDKLLTFWIIGSGKMQGELERSFSQSNLPCVFLGDQPADKMPDFMNCIDILVLPSKNEGLPLVVVEAIACGSNAVGSDVGGMSEVVGKENVFPHGESFVENISDRIVYMLTHTVEQPLGNMFDWRNTARKEIEVYNKLLG